MVELKTLKDILSYRRENINFAFEGKDERMMAHLHTFINKFEEEITQEAIKWAGYFQKDIDVLERNRLKRGTAIKDRVQECFEEKVGWIQNFFNITKEDLI